jgi:uncharacterized protein YlaI
MAIKELCMKGHNFSLRGRIPTGRCRECNRLRMHNYRTKLKSETPELWIKQYSERNWRHFNILNQDKSPFTMIDFDRLYQIQQGKCALCQRHQTQLSERFIADHDHNTGFIRGLLCRRCNSRINILDGGTFTTKVLDYLKIKIVKEN